MLLRRYRITSSLLLVAALLSATPCAASCLVAGDSIAVGLGPALGCTTDARGGIPSSGVIARVHPGHDLTVISAGSNDPANPRLPANLRAARARATGRVVWVVPANAARAAVTAAAAQRGDRAVSFVAGPDGLHPQSYGALAKAIQGEK